MREIHEGDVEALRRLLVEDPGLATRRIDGKRTLLHVATDWPGHFPRVAETIAVLVAAGADVNAAIVGVAHSAERPLHWAASSDDLEALNALLEHGAEIEAPGAVIGGGTALADAVAFGQWRCARRLVECGATANLWQAAALGLLDRLAVEAGPEEITKAFWCACHGGQLEAAKMLWARGADVHWVGYDGKSPVDAAKGNPELVAWLRGIGA